MVTITDVSRLAKVSKATVSRVLSGSRGVREDSRDAVLRAAQELNYRPNVLAQNLASQRSNYIGVILSSADHNRIASFLPLIAQGLKRLGKDMLVYFADTAEEQRELVQELEHGQCAAVILIGGKDASLDTDNLIRLDGVMADSDTGVSYNYAFATESACRYLLGKGHKQIALLIENKAEPISARMLEGYRLALQHQAIPYNRQLVVEHHGNAEQAIMSLINSYAPFSALIVKEDSYAAEAIRLLREFNLAVPQEVSVMGIEGSSLAEQLSPPLTCISYPAEPLVESCLKQLDARLNNKPLLDQPASLSGRLVIRGSVTSVGR